MTSNGIATRDDEIEQQFGIKSFASPNVPGFAAVLKGRYSDFCVREGMHNKKRYINWKLD